MKIINGIRDVMVPMAFHDSTSLNGLCALCLLRDMGSNRGGTSADYSPMSSIGHAFPLTSPFRKGKKGQYCSSPVAMKITRAVKYRAFP